MSADNTADLTGAIASLSTALESMEQRQANITLQVNITKQRRRERLDQRVATLLSDISSATMERLKQEVPSFALDHKVMAAFEQKRMILWLFKPNGYDETLALLQAQLKLYSERQGFVSDEDQAIQRLESEKAALATQQSEALEMMRLMEKAHRANTPLPPEAVSSINSMAQRGRNLNSARLLKRPPVGASRFTGSQSSTVPASSKSDTDLWLWMMTDIPTSFRTLMLDSFSHNHGPNSNQLSAGNGNFSGAGASGDFSPIPIPTVGQETSVQIATDDSLGVFS